MSAWIPRSYPPKDHMPRLGSGDCSCKEEPLKDPPVIPETQDQVLRPPHSAQHLPGTFSVAIL